MLEPASKEPGLKPSQRRATGERSRKEKPRRRRRRRRRKRSKGERERETPDGKERKKESAEELDEANFKPRGLECLCSRSQTSDHWEPANKP